MIDVNDEAFLRGDRSEVYARLRHESPAHRITTDDGQELWLVSRHKDVQAIARLAEGRVQPPGLDAPAWISTGPALQRLRANLAQTDAPIHTRLRSLLGPLFVPRQVEYLREISRHSVQRTISAISDFDVPFDAVRNIATEVPKGVICHLLGIPEEDWDMLTANQHDFLMIFSPLPLDGMQKARLDEVVSFYMEYFDRLLKASARPDRSALVQSLCQAEEDGLLSHLEVLSIMHTVLDAGYETTRTSISNAIELLAVHPDLFAQIKANLQLIPNAVEEILRVRSPIHVRNRYLVDAYEASDGTMIPAGAQILMGLASANQDESVFPEAGKIDFQRANATRHQAFGGGLHHCLGAPIARIQLQETLLELAANFDSLHLPDGPGQRYASLTFPALSSLRVVATATARA